MRRIMVDSERCQKIAAVVDGLRHLTPGSFRPKLIGREGDLFFIFIVTGICHQINWHFLTAALERIRDLEPEKFTPEYMVGLTHEELREWLSGYSKPWRLEPRFRRAELVRGMCRLLLDKHGGSVVSLFESAEGKLGGKQGLYARLTECEAYGEDPLRKKTSVLVEWATRWNLANFDDWGSYIPPIDYHICRVAIRAGTLIVQDKELLEMLRSYAPVSKDVDIEIRSAAIEAIKETAKHITQSSMMDLQGLFWALGRDCCHEDELHCFSCTIEGCSVRKHYPQLQCRSFCPLQSVCRAVNEDRTLLTIREQNFVTTWY